MIHESEIARITTNPRRGDCALLLQEVCRLRSAEYRAVRECHDRELDISRLITERFEKEQANKA